eukprot:snap_masked-scaffold_42-processed-gene-1.29-mRNA-1 protein AED:1.00 eAED:1.00 QI:0/-1/0/0/-1/1/1/0/89
MKRKKWKRRSDTKKPLGLNRYAGALKKAKERKIQQEIERKVRLENETVKIQKNKARMKSNQNHSERTTKGQPVMRYQIESLLKKIEKQC